LAPYYKYNNHTYAKKLTNSAYGFYNKGGEKPVLKNISLTSNKQMIFITWELNENNKNLKYCIRRKENDVGAVAKPLFTGVGTTESGYNILRILGSEGNEYFGFFDNNGLNSGSRYIYYIQSSKSNENNFGKFMYPYPEIVFTGATTSEGGSQSGDVIKETYYDYEDNNLSNFDTWTIYKQISSPK